MRRFVYVNDKDITPFYCKNKISNTKYTLLSFLPKNLMEQFSRFMNKYFLVVACLQLWSAITPVSPASTWGPLAFIFTVSALKEAWDDYHRYIQDREANVKMVWVVRNGSRTRVQSQDICVGDILWLRENDEVPCDLVLLGASEPLGFCYVETAALDGETDLKSRSVPAPCIGITPELLHKMKGVVDCPAPDRDITRFDANLRLFPPFIDTEFCPVTINNTLLQSCILRNTEWACGVAIYTGNETKLGMSKGVPVCKATALDGMIDKLTAIVFAFQVSVVLVLGVWGNSWKSMQWNRLWYVMYPTRAPWYEFLIIPLRFELLCSIMIPISLKVTLDLAKALYAKFIDWDLQMYDEDNEVPARATNTALSEDLGQVEYILTDKTGTLTENKMVFKRCCIADMPFGIETGDALTDPRLLRAVFDRIPEVIDFLMVMAVCNTVVPTTTGTLGDLTYKAASQDEEALVKAAGVLQCQLTSRHGSTAEVLLLGEVEELEVLDVLEFTSDRKRMSVVVRDPESHHIRLLTKGADEAIFPLLLPQQDIGRTQEHVEQYAQMGLRTLCLACRDIDEDEYKAWAVKFKEANSSIHDREWKVGEVCEMLERDLLLLGASAIEDKLQEGVPETIDILRRAGIAFWMLTGDKTSTAIQIALACNFILPEPQGHLLHVQGQTEPEVGICLERVLRTIRISKDKREMAFVIDGWCLEIALNHHLEIFTELSMLARSAICCRITPSQKAQLVQLVKSCDFRTLAIGDGGNDVRMIQEAHVGVGISGREGQQAARAADYSIGKFRFLKRLILIHGRYSYHRTCFIAQFSIYKSLLLSFIQLFFAFLSGLSGTSLFNSFSLMAYNVIYTGLPAPAYVLDKDISEAQVMAHPQILLSCHSRRGLNTTTFTAWFFRAFFHASVVFGVTVNAFVDDKSEFQLVGMAAFSGCILLQTLTIALETNSFTVYQHVVLWGELGLFLFVNLLVSTLPSQSMFSVMFRLCNDPVYWFSLLLMGVMGMAPLLVTKALRLMYRPSAVQVIQMIDQSLLSSTNGAAYPFGQTASSVAAAGAALVAFLVSLVGTSHCNSEREGIGPSVGSVTSSVGATVWPAILTPMLVLNPTGNLVVTGRRWRRRLSSFLNMERLGLGGGGSWHVDSPFSLPQTAIAFLVHAKTSLLSLLGRIRIFALSAMSGDSFLMWIFRERERNWEEPEREMREREGASSLLGGVGSPRESSGSYETATLPPISDAWTVATSNVVVGAKLSDKPTSPAGCYTRSKNK